VVKDFLQTLVREIKMTPHGEPHIVTYPTPELGFTAFMAIQMLYESYIVYDNWVELGYANVVVNSCKEYDEATVMKAIIDFFKPHAVMISHKENYTGVLVHGGVDIQSIYGPCRVCGSDSLQNCKQKN